MRFNLSNAVVAVLCTSSFVFAMPLESLVSGRAVGDTVGCVCRGEGGKLVHTTCTVCDPCVNVKSLCLHNSKGSYLNL